MDIMDINDLKIGQVKELLSVINGQSCPTTKTPHPMLGRRCLIRTYSAGVHIGNVVYADGMEVKLENSLRLYNWEGALSLSIVASKGITGGKLNKTGEIYLTNVIEFIPTTFEAETSYVNFIKN